MKRYIFILLFAGICNVAFAQNQQVQNIWQLNFYTIDSFHLDMKFYAGKKIIVYAFDAAHPDLAVMRSLDSLNRNNNSRLAVIGIPVNDFTNPPGREYLLSVIRDTLSLSYPVANISRGRRGAGGQHALMKWITSTSRKNHFNVDLGESGELFIISTQGLLYAVLGKGIWPTGTVMAGILNSEPLQN